MKRILVIGLFLAFLLAIAYYNVGGGRALELCGATPPGTPEELVAAGISWQWSFAPPGFRCVFTDNSGSELGTRHVGLWP